MRKIRKVRFFQLLSLYFAWTGFSSTVLILGTGFASLDLIRVFGFPLLNAVLSYGLLIFFGMVDGLLLALVIVALEVILENIFKRSLEFPFRLAVVSVFATAWLFLLVRLVGSRIFGL